MSKIVPLYKYQWRLLDDLSWQAPLVWPMTRHHFPHKSWRNQRNRKLFFFFFWVKRNRELSVISNMSLVNKKYFTIYLFYFYFFKIFMRNYLPFLKGYKSISTYFSSSFLFKPNKGKIICSKKKKIRFFLCFP